METRLDARRAGAALKQPREDGPFVREAAHEEPQQKQRAHVRQHPRRVPPPGRASRSGQTVRRRAGVAARGDGVGDGVGGDEERLQRAAKQCGERVRGAPPPQRVPVYSPRREPERNVAHLLEHDAGEPQRKQQCEDDLVHGHARQSERTQVPAQARRHRLRCGGAEREVRGLQHGEGEARGTRRDAHALARDLRGPERKHHVVVRRRQGGEIE